MLPSATRCDRSQGGSKGYCALAHAFRPLDGCMTGRSTRTWPGRLGPVRGAAVHQPASAGARCRSRRADRAMQIARCRSRGADRAVPIAWCCGGRMVDRKVDGYDSDSDRVAATATAATPQQPKRPGAHRLLPAAGCRSTLLHSCLRRARKEGLRQIRKEGGQEGLATRCRSTPMNNR